MAKWQEIPLGKGNLMQNVKEAVLTKGNAALENCFATDEGGVSAFPGLIDFATLGGSAPTYLDEWRGDLVAVTNGRVTLIDRLANKRDVTAVSVAGGKRVIFDRTENELLMAAGGPIVRLAKMETEMLAREAPESTHARFVDGYVVAIEKNSGRFYHSEPDGYRVWDPINVFSAEGKPDDLNAAIVTPFRELIMAGPESIEQFERLPSGDTPFFRRWSVGEGVYAPYTAVAVDNGVWAVNRLKEFVKITGQLSHDVSDSIGMSLEAIDDWTDAWAVPINILGQKFILLQMPQAMNVYETKGVTALYDYRQKKWFNLFGWNDGLGLPERWPGWSYYSLWNRHFVGGAGRVYEMRADAYTNAGTTRRVLGRTAHYRFGITTRVDNMRITLKRGLVGSDADEPAISVRVRRDNKDWTRWRRKGLGRAGHKQMAIEFGGMGIADTFQVEWEITAACEVEIRRIDALVEAIG